MIILALTYERNVKVSLNWYILNNCPNKLLYVLNLILQYLYFFFTVFLPQDVRPQAAVPQVLVPQVAAPVDFLSPSSGCFWSGTSPFCIPACGKNFHEVLTDVRGDGKRCWTGFKKRCCPIPPGMIKFKG